MKGVTTTLAQVQQRILHFVGPETFLVGHSLENDLRVMKLVHLKNLDTAILYPNARVCPSCLQHHQETSNLQGATSDNTQDVTQGVRLSTACLQSHHACDASNACLPPPWQPAHNILPSAYRSTVAMMHSSYCCTVADAQTGGLL